MRFAALGFTLGVWLLQHQPELPGVRWLALYFTFAAIAAIGFITSNTVTPGTPKARPGIQYGGSRAELAPLPPYWVPGSRLRLARG